MCICTVTKYMRFNCCQRGKKMWGKGRNARRLEKRGRGGGNQRGHTSPHFAVYSRLARRIRACPITFTIYLLHLRTFVSPRERSRNREQRVSPSKVQCKIFQRRRRGQKRKVRYIYVRICVHTYIYTRHKVLSKKIIYT